VGLRATGNKGVIMGDEEPRPEVAHIEGRYRRSRP
jgi:hypothetical protein